MSGLLQHSLFSMVIGVTLLAIILLWRSRSASLNQLPLMGFLLAIAATSSAPLLVNGDEQHIAFAIAIILPSICCISPCLWLYVKAFTQLTTSPHHQAYLKHFVPAFFACLLSLVILAQPQERRSNIFLLDDFATGPLEIGILLGFLVVCMIWLCQFFIYGFTIIHRLMAYRRQLKLVFSNTDKLELGWVNWLLIIIAGCWCYLLVSLSLQWIDGIPSLTMTGGALMCLIMVLVASIHGVSQKASFVVEPLEQEALNMVEQEKSQDRKYEKSALSDEYALKIKNKLELAMNEQQLFLDPALSLPKLAKLIGVSQYYVSQTLSEIIGRNFYDYVSYWRIQYAQKRLRDSNLSVLAIAMECGFNARSSFYTAFKKELNLSPGEYRKQCLDN